MPHHTRNNRSRSNTRNLVTGLNTRNNRTSSSGFLYKKFDDMSAREIEVDRLDFWKSMPAIYKKAYNDSIGGMMHEMMTGEKYYDLNNIEYSQVQDVAALMLSFFASKEDIAAFAIPGGAVGKSAQLLMKAGKLGKSGLAKRKTAAVLARRGNISYKSASKIVDDVIDHGFPQAAALGTHGAFHESARRTRDEILENGETIEMMTGKKYDKFAGSRIPILGYSTTPFNLKDTNGMWKHAFSSVMSNTKPGDFAKNAFVGYVGGVSRALRVIPDELLNKGKISEMGWAYYGLKKLGTEAYRKRKTKLGHRIDRGLLYDPESKMFAGMNYEIGTFGLLAGPVYEGRRPEGADFLMAAGTVGALQTIGGAFRYGRGKTQGKLELEFSKSKTVQEAELAAKSEKFGNEIQYELLNPNVKDPPVIKGVDQKAYNQRVGEGASTTKAKREATVSLGGRKVGILDETISQDAKGNVTMKIRVGKSEASGPKGETIIKEAGTIKLDAKNTKKFFDYYVEKPGEYRAIYGSLIKKRKGETTKFDKVRNEKVIEKLYNDTKKSKNGYTKKDWDDAIGYLINNRGFARLKKIVDSGKDIKPSMLNRAEKALLAKTVDDARYINNFVNTNFWVYNATRLFNPAGIKNKDKSIVSRMFNVFKPAYDQLDDKYAKMALRMLEEVNIGTQQKTAKRYSALEKIVGLGDPGRGQFFANLFGGAAPQFSKSVTGWWKNYLEKGGAWNDFRSIQLRNEKLIKQGKKATGKQEFIDSLAKQVKSKKLTRDEKHKIQLKLELLESTQSLTNEIFFDAKSVGINVAGYVDAYVPLMFRKEILDTLYDGTNSVHQRLAKVMDVVELKDIKNFKKADLEELNKIIMEVVQPMINKAEKQMKAKSGNVNAFGAMWKKIARKRADGSDPTPYEVWATIANGMNSLTGKKFAPLEKSRRLGNFKLRDSKTFNEVFLEYGTDTSSGFYEKNFISLYQDYISGATKRIEMSRAFTPGMKLLNNLKDKIDPMNSHLITKREGFGFVQQGMDVFGYGARNEKLALEMIIEGFTGDFNFKNRTTMAKFLQSINNMEMTTKIASGFAPIVNLTQPLISTMMQSPLTALKVMTTFARNPMWGKGKNKQTMRDFIRESGSTVMTAFSEIMTNDPILQIGAAKRAVKWTETPSGTIIRDAIYGKNRNVMRSGIDVIGETGEKVLNVASNIRNNPRAAIAEVTRQASKWSGFTGINEWNQMFSAAVMEEQIRKWTKILSGDKQGFGILDTIAPNIRKKWAKNMLRKIGLSEKDVLANKQKILARDYGASKVGIAIKEKVQRGMTRYALDSQMQRSFTKDPFLFNDPNWKALFIFKRFGLRQAIFMKKEIEDQALYGNLMPILQLGTGGVAGGKFVMWAREKYTEVLTGEEQYYGLRNRKKMLDSDLMFKDYVNSLAMVGSFGMVTDMMQDSFSEEQGIPITMATRFLTPVQLDDIAKAGDAAWDIAMEGKPWWHEGYRDVPFRKAWGKTLPILGGIPSRLFRRSIETEKMTRDRVSYYKRQTVREVRSLIIAGRKEEARDIIDEFNYTFGRQWINRTGFSKVKSKLSEGLGLETSKYDSEGNLVEYIDDNGISWYRGYPSLAIKYSDYGYKAIMRELEKPEKKRQEEKVYKR